MLLVDDVENREFLEKELSGLGFGFPGSSANFVFARHPRVSGETLYRTLKERGILVRHFTAPRIREYIRITVGSREELEALLAALKDIIKEEQK